MIPLKDYLARRDEAKQQAEAAYTCAIECAEQARTLPHWDPGYDAAWRCQGLYMQLWEVMRELADDLDIRVENVRSSVA